MADDVKNIIVHCVGIVIYPLRLEWCISELALIASIWEILMTVANELAFSLLEFQVILWIQIFEVDVDVSAPCMAYCRSGSSGRILPVPRRH